MFAVMKDARMRTAGGGGVALGRRRAQRGSASRRRDAHSSHDTRIDSAVVVTRDDSSIVTLAFAATDRSPVLSVASETESELSSSLLRGKG